MAPPVSGVWPGERDLTSLFWSLHLQKVGEGISPSVRGCREGGQCRGHSPQCLAHRRCPQRVLREGGYTPPPSALSGDLSWLRPPPQASSRVGGGGGGGERSREEGRGEGLPAATALLFSPFPPEGALVKLRLHITVITVTTGPPG